LSENQSLTVICIVCMDHSYYDSKPRQLTCNSKF